MTPIHTEIYHGYEIKIMPDNDAERPDAWGDDSVFLVGFHRQFYVTTTTVQKPEDIEAMHKTHHVLPVEAYIHGGVVLALSHQGNFPDRRWDVSQLGAVFVAKTEARTKKQAEHIAKGLLASWNDYLSDNVYGFEVNKDGELVESVWGYYGDYDAEGGALQEARQWADSAKEMAYRKYLLRKKVEIKHRVPLERRQTFIV